MNRFQRKQSRMDRIKRILPAIAVVVIFCCFWQGIGSVSEETQQQQKRSLESAVWKNIVQCYAMEGRYPESLSYIEEHYGLIYDKQRFFVDYEVMGSNMMPDVTVIEQNQEG